jgi:hypothetical protein
VFTINTSAIFKVVHIFCAFDLVYFNSRKGVRDLNVCTIWDETFFKALLVKENIRTAIGYFLFRVLTLIDNTDNMRQMFVKIDLFLAFAIFYIFFKYSNASLMMTLQGRNM